MCLIPRLLLVSSSDNQYRVLVKFITNNGNLATGTAEVGGWSTRELLSILDGLVGLKVVGADVVEVAPVYDNAGETTVLAASEVVHSLLTLMVKTPVQPVHKAKGDGKSEL